MDRRGFLKACGVVASSALIIPAFRLIVPDQSLLPNERWLVTVRELFQFDLDRQAWIMRMDVLADKVQLGVDCLIGEAFPSAKDLVHVREPAALALRNAMEREGLTLADLKPLPIPSGYVTPEWAIAA